MPRHHDDRRTLLQQERGRLSPTAPALVALLYPSPYHVAMSSLGYQTIYRAIQNSGDLGCERFMAPEKQAGWDEQRSPVSLDSGRALRDFPVVAVSVAWELELSGLMSMLHAAGVPPLRTDRSERDPLVLAGGPLTFSNPRPLGAVADAVVMGEADTLAVRALRAALGEADRASQLRALADLPHVAVPGLTEPWPGLACEADDELPAWGPLRTPNTELRNMFLIETVRGCSRGCNYCVMRRSTNRGMRVVALERVLACIPADADRVGLVGASVSDHPHIVELVEALAARGAQVGLSSLRADRLTEKLVVALKRAGYRTLTTAMDGASERLRKAIDRRTTAEQLQQVAERARAAGIERVKLYLMVGLPDETDEDIEECAALVRKLSHTIPVSLGISAFCPKKNTPLAEAPFAGTRVIDKRLALLRARIAGRAEVRATSARWGWVESVLARGGEAEAEAVLQATRLGGSFAAYRRAFEQLGHDLER